MTKTIDNTDDVIDSRDVIARIDELQSEREDLVTAVQDAKDLHSTAETEEDVDAAVSYVQEAEEELKDWDDSNGDELKALLALQSEAEGYSEDWLHGSALVRDSYWTAYAQELLADIGDLPKDLPSYIVIDWEATALNIQADYTSVEFDGVTYWVR